MRGFFCLKFACFVTSHNILLSLETTEGKNMTTERKKPMTGAERQRLTRERLKQDGGGQIAVNISGKANKVLEQLTKELGSQRAAIEYAILQHEQRSLI